ncbi:MAG: site-2 protease family protein [Turneriella sp.]|nr:site-2 protease family protein [Leptospiraceae bacterium]MCX7631811.1 site-2 protease family protein [Turneriella sp.]
MLAILAGILLLGICIFFHELGHFWIGKLVGVRPKIFSIGYGRGVIFRRHKGTIYQITAIPLGGYVQFYGDDPRRQNRPPRKGEFFSVGPWRRIALAAGGPLFSILLGFLVVFLLLLTGHRPMDNVVRVDARSAAYKAGLRSGDRIVAVEGSATPSFERILYEVGFAREDTVRVEIARGNTTETLHLPITKSEAGTPGTLVGVRPLAQLVMTEDGPQGSGLKKGDVILRANGSELFAVEDLIRILNEKPRDTAELLVLRRAAGSEKQVELQVPLKKVPRVVLRRLRDVQTGSELPELIFEEGAGQDFQNVFINGQSYSSFAEFRAALEKSQNPKLRIGPVEISAEIELGFRRQIGIRPAERPRESGQKLSFLQILLLSVDETVFITKSTLVGLWRILEGKLSFSKSVSGPVKMVALAARSVELGWQTYFLLLAQITIILGVMNLLPIPVLDGGHIVFYLIEALYKPISFKVQAAATRIGMAFLLAIGLYVISIDIIDVFFRRVFG